MLRDLPSFVFAPKSGRSAHTVPKRCPRSPAPCAGTGGPGRDGLREEDGKGACRMVGVVTFQGNVWFEEGLGSSPPAPEWGLGEAEVGFSIRITSCDSPGPSQDSSQPQAMRRYLHEE